MFGGEKLTEESICQDYKNGSNIYELCSKYHIGKLKLKSILNNNGIQLRKQGGQPAIKSYVIADAKKQKYPPIEGYEYIAVSKDGKYSTKDYMNHGGYLTSFIKQEYGISIPSLYDRNEYYKLTGDYWWEQWFDIIKKEKVSTKKCPYCDWETVDVENRSGAFGRHLMLTHGIGKKEYLLKYPEDEKYFRLSDPTLNREFEVNDSKFVKCEICGKKLARINSMHLSKHNISKIDYITKYSIKTLSDDYRERLSQRMKQLNTIIKKSFTSKAEQELLDYINNDLGLKGEKNRSVINQEIDIFIPLMKFGIEYDGLHWHTESQGKDKYYHLNKTLLCNSKGISLIHIFENEYMLHKEIVKSKIRHLLKKDCDLPKIMGRKCEIKIITKTEAQDFLEQYHIQGFSSSSVYTGALYEGKLIAVMTFLKEKEGYWNLTRFATDFNYRMQGVGGKIFGWFIGQYKPIEIKSFADRRWTVDSENNLYIKLGFKLTNVLKPDYKYYNSSVNRFKCYHKFLFRKNILSKKYNLPLTMTEKEMTEQLGFERIWDCGLYKYVWTKAEN